MQSKNAFFPIYTQTIRKAVTDASSGSAYAVRLFVNQRSVGGIIFRTAGVSFPDARLHTESKQIGFIAQGPQDKGNVLIGFDGIRAAAGCGSIAVLVSVSYKAYYCKAIRHITTVKAFQKI